MIKTQMFIAAALFVGVAIGYFAKSDAPVAAADSERSLPAALIADKGEKATIAALRARIAELEKRLASAASGEEKKIVSSSAPTPPAPPARESWRDRIARMEKEDPARYAQMTNRFAQFRLRRLEHAQSRIDFLSSIDTSRMSAAARKTHEDLQDLIEKREELEQRLHQPDLSDDDRRALFGEMRKTDREMHALNRAERDNLLRQTAESIGFEGGDAEELTSTINGIIEATEGMQWGHRRRGR